MSTLIHEFERAGLGKYPFRFIGVEEKTYQAHPSAPVQPGAACDYCGTGIRYLFWCESIDKKRFKVGCDCIRRVSKEPRDKLLTAAEAAQKKLMKENATAKLHMEVLSVREKLNDPNWLINEPHPMFAGKTMRDYVEWMLQNAGAAGKNRVFRLLRKRNLL